MNIRFTSQEYDTYIFLLISWKYLKLAMKRMNILSILIIITALMRIITEGRWLR